MNTVYFHTYEPEQVLKDQPIVKSLLTQEEIKKLPGKGLDNTGISWEKLAELYPDNGLIFIRPEKTCYYELIIKVKGLYDRTLLDETDVSVISIHEHPMLFQIDPPINNNYYSFCVLETDPDFQKYLKKEFSILDGKHFLDEKTFPLIKQIVELAKENKVVDLYHLIGCKFRRKILDIGKNFYASFA